MLGTFPFDPGVDAYEVDGRGLEHLGAVTLVHTGSGPFVFDLFLHGDLRLHFRS